MKGGIQFPVWLGSFVRAWASEPLDLIARNLGCVRQAIGFFAGPACVRGERKNGRWGVTR